MLDVNIVCRSKKKERTFAQGTWPLTNLFHGLPPSVDQTGTCCCHPQGSWAQFPPTATRDYRRQALRCLAMHPLHPVERDTAADRTVTGRAHTVANAWVYPWAESVMVPHLVAATAAGTESFEVVSHSAAVVEAVLQIYP